MQLLYNCMNNRFSTNQTRLNQKGVDESKLSLFDRNSNDLELFNLVDDELIKLSGSKIYYYKAYIDDSYDKIYLETRNRVLSKTPITLWASFDPKVIEEEMNEFGLELTNDQIFVFNKSYIETNIGRPPKEGDVIKTTFQNIKYEIFEVQEDSFEGYGSYHYNCFAKVLRDTDEIVDEPNIEKFEKVGTKVYIERDNSFKEIPPVYEYNHPISFDFAEAGGGAGGGSQTSKVTIRWSPEGVIYVNADSDRSGYYGLGYIHAREYGDMLFGMLSTSIGRTFESFYDQKDNTNFLNFLLDNLAAGARPYKIDTTTGYLDPNFVLANLELQDFDRYLHFFDVVETANDLYNELEEDLQNKIIAFADGVNNGMEALWNSNEFAVARSFFPDGPPITFTPQDIVARDHMRVIGAWMGVYAGTIVAVKDKYREGAPESAGFPYAGVISSDPSQFEDQVKNLNFVSGLHPPYPILNTIDPTKANDETFMFSNEWAFHGQITSTGKPILQTDPHLYQKDASYRFITVSYKSDTMEMAGGMIGGIPNVLLGYNQNVAWALTAGSINSLRFYPFFVIRDPNNPEEMKYFAREGDLDAASYVLEDINTTQARIASFEPPFPIRKSQENNKYQIGRVLSTWYTDSLGVISPPPGSTPYPGSGRYYEIGLAARFPKDFRVNGIRLFHSLNTAKNVDDIKEALAYLDTPFYNFTYASKQNVIGYYNLGTVPDYSKNEGYDRRTPTGGRRPDALLFGGEMKFSHETPLIYWSSLHPVDDLPHVENPEAGWVVCNNATPNYVSIWGPNDPKELVMSSFPFYMHVESFLDLGTERQKQAHIAFSLYTAGNYKITPQDAVNIVTGKGGPPVAPTYNETSWHHSSMVRNLYSNFTQYRNANQLGAGVTLGGVLTPARTVVIDYNKITPFITSFYSAAYTLQLRNFDTDLLSPIFYYFLENLYTTYGRRLDVFPGRTDPESNILYWIQASVETSYDPMKWDYPELKPLKRLDVEILCGLLTEALNDYEQKFGFNTKFSEFFQANSASETLGENGNLYPLNYGGRNLRTLTFNPKYDEFDNLLHYQPTAGQVMGLTVDFGPTTTRAFLSKPIHGTTDPNKSYFSVITRKWAQGIPTEIKNFGYLGEGEYIEQIVITRL